MGRGALAGQPTSVLVSAQAPISGALFHPRGRHVESKAAQTSASERALPGRSLGPRACTPQAAPEHASGQSMPQAGPHARHLSRPAACAALAGHIGLAFDLGSPRYAPWPPRSSLSSTATRPPSPLSPGSTCSSYWATTPPWPRARVAGSSAHGPATPALEAHHRSDGTRRAGVPWSFSYTTGIVIGPCVLKRLLGTEKGVNGGRGGVCLLFIDESHGRSTRGVIVLYIMA